MRSYLLGNLANRCNKRHNKKKKEGKKGNKCRTIINIQFDMKTHKVSSVINMPKQTSMPALVVVAALLLLPQVAVSASNGLICILYI